MASYCKYCGSKLADGAIFCDECGKQINKSDNNDSGLFQSYNIDMMDGEVVIRQSQIHEGCLVLPAVIFGIGILLGLIGFIRYLSISYYYYDPGFVFIIFFNIFTIVGLIWFIIRYIGYVTNDLILTNKRVFGKIGLISISHMQSPLNKIDSVSYTSGLIGRLIGYGTVEIATTSSKFKFRFIREGQTFYNDIFNQLEASQVENRMENAKAIVDAMDEKLS